MLRGRLHVAEAYLFGSIVEGRADEWSDIDLAVFVDRHEAAGLKVRAELSAWAQKEAGDDIELHFFPSDQLTTRDPASFAEYVVTHGAKL